MSSLPEAIHVSGDEAFALTILLKVRILAVVSSFFSSVCAGWFRAIDDNCRSEWDQGNYKNRLLEPFLLQYIQRDVLRGIKEDFPLHQQRHGLELSLKAESKIKIGREKDRMCREGDFNKDA